MKRISAGPALPPLGFNSPPDTASPSAVVMIAALTVAAIVTCVLSIAAYDALTLIAAPRHQLTDAQLFPKEATRCCDANGNELETRR